jgi:hypothetical protein
MGRDIYEKFSIPTTSSSAAFIWDLNDTTEENLRAPLAFFQRQCLRTLISSLLDKKEFFDESAMFVVRHEVITVEETQQTAPPDALAVPLKIIIDDFKADELALLEGDENVAINQCIKISWNIARYLTFSLGGDDGMVAFCHAFKDATLCIEPLETTNIRFSDFERQMACAPTITKDEIQAARNRDLDINTTRLVENARLGVFISILFFITSVGMFIGLGYWLFHSNSPLRNLIAVVFIIFGMGGFIQSFRKSDTLNDMISNNQDPRSLTAILRSIRIAGVVFLTIGGYLLI